MKSRVFGVVALVALAGVLATAAFAGGRGHAQGAGSIKIGVSLAGYSTDFWSSYVAFEKAAATKYGVSLVGPISSDGDAGKQATQIRTLIEQGVNALIINPVDSAAIAPTLAYAASKHVPVVSVDVAPTSGKVYMIVRADNKLYGKDACNYISSHVQGSGHVAVLEGDLASINGLDRTNAFAQCMKSHPNLKVVGYATKWDTPTAVNDAKTAMSTYSDLKAIYTQWSGPVPGIIAAEKAAGKFTKVGTAGHIVLFSDDGTPQEHGWIRAGEEDATMSQPATLYAQYAVYYAKQATEGVKYHAGMKTDHGSEIVNLLGNLEDAIVAPVVSKANVNDPKLWGNYKK
ncbi:MAG TPA: sugar ABC transporter substrate-binding protein [Gaiellaceae bacterium]|nr:sugar ABC transporter substrate-binding protein [Gaiellaceae bacterium]